MNMRTRYVRFAMVIFFIVLVYLLISQNKLDRIKISEDRFTPRNNDEINFSDFLDVPVRNRTGLTATGDHFKLNGVPLTLISGAIHYFRMPPEYWRDRLMKAKMCGLNTVETYVPWNLHEPEPHNYDFSGMLNLKKFILLAQELGLLVIVRPGPYICSEWEFGGLPSWLLADPDMKVRTMHPRYIEAASSYFSRLLPIIDEVQYQKGGPVIALQLDNEYGSYFKDDKYLPFLKDLVRRKGIVELLFLSDSVNGLRKQTLDGVLKTVNFKYVGQNLAQLKQMQGDAPMMVMEFWTGWFDWWGERHHTLSLGDFQTNLDRIFTEGSSVNFYMFHGGTNFGFMNGGFMNGKTYQSDITSYDYDALLTEGGDITPKYLAAQKIIAKHFNLNLLVSKLPKSLSTVSYPTVSIIESVSMWDVLNQVPSVSADEPVPMEMLTNIGGQQQSYGYILYRAKLKTSPSYSIRGFSGLNDRGVFYLNGHKQNAINNMNKEHTFKSVIPVNSNEVVLDVLVENGGRINWEQFNNQRKGLYSNVVVNGDKVGPWTIYSFEMKSNFINKLTGWGRLPIEPVLQNPSFFKATVNMGVDEVIKDTYLDMSAWGKGVVFVNGKNLGRYWNAGPQMTLYLPAPWLKTGSNQFVIFEETKMSSTLRFAVKPNINA